MDKLARLHRLRQLVLEAGGQVDGRKKLHKLAYLCQRAGTDLGQAFLFHMYGVYSPSLARELDAARAWGILKESEAGDGYRISVGSEAPGADLAMQDEAPGFAVVHQLASESPAMLEAVSTIVYLWDRGYHGEPLVRKLTELKGHLAGVFPEAFALAKKHFGIAAVSAAS